MKLKHNKIAIQLAIILLISFGCEGQNETESGIKYEMIVKGSGEKPPNGGTWLVNMAYYDSKGDTLFSTQRDKGGPTAMPYNTDYFPENGSFEECFGLMAKGDSAIFTVSADSLYRNSFGQPTPADYQGTTIELRIGIAETYTKEEYDAILLEEAKEQLAEEKRVISEYLQNNGIDAEVTEEGLYYQITKKGDGPIPTPGQRVKVNYTGALLDGTVFDTSVEEDAKTANVFNPNRNYEPIAFSLGQGEVIRGWDLGIGLLPVGSKAKFVIPSPLAYRDQQRGPIIKPNSILVFDIELVEIVE